MNQNDISNGINLLSLFNGMGCASLAIEEAGIKVNKRYSSEIEKFPNHINDALYPDTIQLGDVRNVKGNELGFIHVLAGGSPCQSFSFAGKRKGMSTKCEIDIITLEDYLILKEQNFEFEGQSYLFWEYVRILKEVREINPDVFFLLENVVMGEKWQKILSRAIGINAILINSALLSAQNRKRLYWTNIGVEQVGLFGDLECTIPQPKDKGILLKDILETDVADKYFLSGKMLDYLNSRKANYNNGKINYKTENDIASCINSSSGAIDISDNIIIDTNRKARCFTAGGNSGGLHSQMDLVVHNTMPRSSKTGKGGTGPLSRNDGKTYCLDTGNTNAIEIQCVAMRGRNPENPKSRVAGLPTEQQLEPRNDGKTNCLTSVQKDNLVSYCLTPKRTEFGKEVRKDYESGKLEFQRKEITELQPREDGKTNTLSTVTKDNLIEYSYRQDTPVPESKDKYQTLRANGGGKSKGLGLETLKGNIRRLTPRECARLQTVKEDKIEIILNCGVSDSQLYRAFGNGWTIDVIAYIFSFLPKEYFKN